MLAEVVSDILIIFIILNNSRLKLKDKVLSNLFLYKDTCTMMGHNT